MSSASLPGDSSVREDRDNPRPGIEHLSGLLAKLDQDPDKAGRAYEELRRRLILFFRIRRPQEAEDLADTVLDRVARRLADGIEIEKIEFYSVGVARFVLRERFAATEREERAREDLAYAQQMQSAAPLPDPSSEARLRALADCLKNLEGAERAMILRYYAADGPQRMRMRYGLAQQMRVSLNALHNRALRLRKQLEHCVESRMTRGTA
jgi:DNA-directed RNA polymerase specialized sigma24 family protein